MALHILTLLAQQPEESVTSELLAGSIHTNPVFARRILGDLSHADLVVSQPGVGGGWRLLREPGAITLRDVYRAVHQGHLLDMHRSEPNPDCLVGRNIQRTLMDYFGEAEDAFEEVLGQQTVAQILATVREDPSVFSG